LFTLIHFSPTGNALHLARTLADGLQPHDVELIALESIAADQPPRGEHLVLLYPVHAFNAPRNVKQFVKRLQPGLFTTVSLIGVGCMTNWLNGAVSADLRKLFAKKGYPICLDEILAMPLTLFTSFPDELACQVIAESERATADLSTALIEGRITTVSVRRRSRVLSFFGKAEQVASRFFGLELRAGQDCNSCGICWEHCPQRNIQPNGARRPRFGFDCLMCMRCIYNCPQRAISPRFSRFLPIKDGYSLSRYRDGGSKC
jgi:ferredoxin